MGKIYNISIIYPVDISIHAKSQGFGDTYLDYSAYGLKAHNGDDWYPKDGLSHEVFAADDWTVAELYRDPKEGYGYGVALLHKWGRTKYGHFCQMPCDASGKELVVGQKGKRGDQIGWTGSTGNSTGLHLHFGVYPTGEPYGNGYKGAVDPTPYYMAVAPTPGAGSSTTPVAGVVKAGDAEIMLPSGVRLRLGASTISGQVVGLVYPGMPFVAESEIVIEGDVVFRKVAAWIAESQGGVMYMANVK